MVERIKKIDLEGIDPLAPVAMEPLQTSRGTKVNRCAIILDPDGVRKEVGIVSQDYALVPNNKAYQVALDIMGRSSLKFEPEGCAFDGRRYRQRWVVAEPEHRGEVKPGDFVSLGLDVVNSYDGSTMFGLNFIAQRLTCSNGMVVDFALGGFRFRHWASNGFDGKGHDAWQGELAAAENTLTVLPEKIETVLPAFQKMTEMKCFRQDYQRIFKELGTSDGMAGQVIKAVDGDTLWDCYNGFTRCLSQKATVSGDNLNRNISQYMFEQVKGFDN